MKVRHQKGPIYNYVNWVATSTKSNDYPHSVPPDRNVPVIKSCEYEIAVGSNTPRFYKAQREGYLLPFTGYVKRSLNYDRSGWRDTKSTFDPAGYWYRIVVSNWLYLQPPVFGSVELGAVLDLVADHRDVARQLVQKSAANIYDEGHDALTSLAELHKVRKLFFDLGYRLGRLRDVFADSVRKRRLTRKQFEALYASWLEGRYGWRTLLYEIESLNSFAHRIKKGKVYDRLYKRSTASDSISENLTSVVPIEAAWSGNRTTTSTRTIEMVGSVAADLNLALTALNPIVTGWELIRFSFVIDWFISVGNAIKAASLSYVASAHTASMGWRIVTNSHSELDAFPLSSLYPEHTLTGGAHAEVTYEEEVLIREPTDIISRPFVTVRLNAMKIVDLIALVQRAKPVI